MGPPPAGSGPVRRLIPGSGAGRPFDPRAWRQLAATLGGPHRASACRAVVDGAVVVLTLRRRGLRPLLGHRPDLVDADPVRARAIARAVDAGLAVLPAAPTCLRRSVTLLRELNRCGLAATLHIGVRTSTGDVEAHAWVQVDGTVVNDDADLVGTYAPLAVGDVELFTSSLS